MNFFSYFPIYEFLYFCTESENLKILLKLRLPRLTNGAMDIIIYKNIGCKFKLIKAIHCIYLFHYLGALKILDPSVADFRAQEF